MSLDEVAISLGVHYQTAYKWVRSGSLPAARVGRTYQIEPGDLARFEADRSRPAPPPKRRPRQGFDRLASRLFEALVAGDERKARSTVAGLLTDGLSMTEVASDVIAPAMRRIGAEWHGGTLSISTEHRATAIVERLLGENLPNPRGRRRGRALVASVSGDRHGLATTMAMVALREDNWAVDHLGGDVPPEEIITFAHANGLDLVVLTVVSSGVADAAQELASRLREDGFRVLVGAPGLTLLKLQEQARNK